ncbi:Rpp14/Pop5 family-domain-containing protein [Ampelomyces quisqualis]|uniref:Ribonuclease P/MRP protein subunit POP5 n=1 Tax=Ampelomyces quisqualis TaxID=50730 RepID=A0A6A5QYQ5_AMPQU|nr:Rpp14/Pop5 family-domain-containing protein [Ampelomyces quisqualis]
MVRVKHRYLVVNFLYPAPVAKSKTPLPDLVQIHSPTPDSFHAGVLARLVRDHVEELFGDYGMGMVSTGLKVNYWSPSTSTAIIRCPRDHFEMVWAALTYITRLPKPSDVPVVVRVIRVSGTIRKAEEDVLRRSHVIIKRAKAWEAKDALPMLQSVQKAADQERKRENAVLAQVDAGSEDEEMSD